MELLFDDNAIDRTAGVRLLLLGSDGLSQNQSNTEKRLAGLECSVSWFRLHRIPLDRRDCGG